VINTFLGSSEYLKNIESILTKGKDLIRKEKFIALQGVLNP